MGFEITWEPPHGVIKRHFGQVTSTEVLVANTRVEADSRFDVLRYVINDFLDCTGVKVFSGDIEEIAAIDSAAALVNPYIRNAIVATHPEVVVASNAYANDPLTAYPTKVFSCIADARDWLGLSSA